MQADGDRGRAATQFHDAVALLKASRTQGRPPVGAASVRARLARAAELVEAELKQRGQLK